MLKQSILDKTVKELSQDAIFNLFYQSSQLVETESKQSKCVLELLNSRYSTRSSFFDEYQKANQRNDLRSIMNLEAIMLSNKINNFYSPLGKYFCDNTKLNMNDDEREATKYDLKSSVDLMFETKYFFNSVNIENFLGIEPNEANAKLNQMYKQTQSEFNRTNFDISQVMEGNYSSLNMPTPIEVKFTEVNDGKSVGFDYYINNQDDFDFGM